MRTLLLLAAGAAACLAPGIAQAQAPAADCEAHLDQIEAALRSGGEGAQAIPDPGTAFEKVEARAALTEDERARVEEHLAAARRHAQAGEETQCMAEVQQANSYVFVMDDSLRPPTDEAAER